MTAGDFGILFGAALGTVLAWMLLGASLLRLTGWLRNKLRGERRDSSEEAEINHGTDFPQFPRDVKRQLVGVVSYHSAMISATLSSPRIRIRNLPTDEGFREHLKGLPDYALDWLGRFLAQSAERWGNQEARGG